MFELRLVTAELFFLSPPLMVHTVGCGFSRTCNVVRIVADWGGQESRLVLVGCG